MHVSYNMASKVSMERGSCWLSCLSDYEYSNCFYTAVVFHLNLFMQAFACLIFVSQCRVVWILSNWLSDSDAMTQWGLDMSKNLQFGFAPNIAFFELATASQWLVRRKWLQLFHSIVHPSVDCEAEVPWHNVDSGNSALDPPFLWLWFGLQNHKGKFGMPRHRALLHVLVF